MTIRPDGTACTCSPGVGNLGTHSVIDLARVAADVLEMPWEKVDVNWGDTSKGLPWTCLSVGSQTTHAMTRANHAGAMDAKRKLQEIAAKDLGGSPDDYVLGGERVFRTGQPVAGSDLRAGRDAGDRARRPLRRARATGGHSRRHEGSGRDQRRPGLDGRRQGRLPARRRHLFIRRRLCRSRSGCRNRRRHARRFPGRRRRRHGGESAQPDRARSTAAAASASRTRCTRSSSTIRTTACRWRAASTTTSR